MNEQPLSSDKTREGMDELANEFDYSGRKMTADTWYYGLNMEKNK